MPLLKFELNYEQDTAKLFEKIAHMPWAIYLDSGQPESQYGRYDILVADPFITLVTEGKLTRIEKNTGHGQYDAVDDEGDPFQLIKDVLSDYVTAESDFPFCGGAIGYFSYDLSRRIEPIAPTASDVENIPQMMVGIYDWAIIIDHKLKRAHLVSENKAPKTKSDWPKLCQMLKDETAETLDRHPFALLSDVTSNMTKAAYASAFDRVKQYIYEGDCYQVNLAQRFSVKAKGSGWLAYLQLKKISPAPFMTYMNLPGVEVLSASPERFLQVKGSHVETRPIKGTRPRSLDEKEDAANALSLQNSQKDRAENLMIVDLLRNDISKTCDMGSVRADRLFALESFANVHHLVSTVTGKLSKTLGSIDLLRGCFPGGSITGAPKLRAMQIIEELEPNRRGLYCGSVAYIGFDGNMDSNITIRTAVYSGDEVRFWAGGGIVADSEMEKEYKETWDKASSMIDLVKFFQSKDSY